MPGLGDGSLWPALFTGVNPGRHGRFYFNQIQPGSYETPLFNDDKDYGQEPFWDALSRAGCRVAIIDVVRAPLSKNLNGILLADWTTHDRNRSARSWPAGLICEVEKEFGRDPFNGHATIRQRSEMRYQIFRDQLMKRIKAKTKLSRHYLTREPWDLFMTVFADPHDVGHLCWHLHDPSHPDHNSCLAAHCGDLIKDVYRAIDAAIAELLAVVDSDTTVIVFLGPGMEANYAGNHLLDQVLTRLEGQSMKTSVSAVRWLRFAGSRLAPAALRNGLRSRFTRLESGIHWESRVNRKYFTVPHSEVSGAIRLNVMGREPNGTIKAGKDFDTHCQKLTEELLQLINLDTQKPVVREVIKVADSLPNVKTSTTFAGPSCRVV